MNSIIKWNGQHAGLQDIKEGSVSNYHFVLRLHALTAVPKLT